MVVQRWQIYLPPKVNLDLLSTGTKTKKPRCDFRIRRSTLYGFENLSVSHHFHRDAEISRSTGAVFIYVSMGMVTLTDHYGKIEPWLNARNLPSCGDRAIQKQT